jgi:hypothetical protein
MFWILLLGRKIHFYQLDLVRDKRKLMDIYEPFPQVSMWGDSFKVEGGLNSIASPMLLVNTTTSMENKVSNINIIKLIMLFSLICMFIELISFY